MHYNLAIDWHHQGKLEEAIAECRTAIRLKPDDTVTHYNLGNALAGQGRPEEAIAEYHKARDNAPRGSKLAQLIERALTEPDH
jgi:tetratricopeptide (TPR) repeat protein